MRSIFTKFLFIAILQSSFLFIIIKNNSSIILQYNIPKIHFNLIILLTIAEAKYTSSSLIKLNTYYINYEYIKLQIKRVGYSLWDLQFDRNSKLPKNYHLIFTIFLPQIYIVHCLFSYYMVEHQPILQSKHQNHNLPLSVEIFIYII